MIEDALIGKTLNGYQMIEKVAQGGMATVYRAHQISMNRDVAVKVLPREFLHEPAFLERFRQEASIAARLEHRAIVPVHDYGEWENIPYIVMRYMEGGSVDGLLADGPLPLEEVQKIVRQVSTALDYAHSQGVLHRDLKPSNILLDRHQDAYITDFGIARILSKDEKLTSTGVVGTPAYMSPEQAQGLELDGRSDLYALGVVIYEMVTGRRPFEGETPYSIAVMHVTKPVPPPRQMNPDIAEGVEMVILKALEKDRNLRFKTARELAGALDDADLLPLAVTVKRPTPQPAIPSPAPPMSPVVYAPQALIQQPMMYPAYIDSSTQPTPRRMMPAVVLPPPQRSRRRRQLSPVMILTIVTVLALLAALLIGGVYFLLAASDETVADPIIAPDYLATGAARLDGTLSAPTPLPAIEGRLVFTSDSAGQPDLYILDLETGNQTRLTDTPGIEANPALSADGQWVTYTYNPDMTSETPTSTQSEIYMMRVDGTGRRQLTSNLAEEMTPTWTPDSANIVYVQMMTGVTRYRIVRQNVQTGNTTVLFQGNGRALHPSVSPNGAWVVFSAGESSDTDTWEIRFIDIVVGTFSTLTDNTFYEWSPVWSADGERVVFLRETAGGGVVVEMRPDGSGQLQILNNAGLDSTLSYSPDSRYLLLKAGMNNQFSLALLDQQASDLIPLGLDGYNPVWLPG